MLVARNSDLVQVLHHLQSNGKHSYCAIIISIKANNWVIIRINAMLSEHIISRFNLVWGCWRTIRKISLAQMTVRTLVSLLGALGNYWRALVRFSLGRLLLFMQYYIFFVNKSTLTVLCDRNVHMCFQVNLKIGVLKCWLKWVKIENEVNRYTEI